MRGLVALVVAALLIAGGCAANSYRIPHDDLQRLATTPPEVRGQRVRVIQELGGTSVPAAQPVDGETQIVVGGPRVSISGGGTWGSGGRWSNGGRWGGRGGGKLGGGGGGGGSGSDGKAAAIAFLVIAAVALFAVAGVEGSRFDGWANLHPMHPVHLIGRDGGYTVLPLAWIDPATAAWADKAVVRPTEGPWTPLERHPLHRTGPTYSMYGGVGTLRSAHGDLGSGPAFTVQAGYFPAQQIGIVGSVFFGWRENQAFDTLFESRYTLELQTMPLVLGRLHAGFYAGAGGAYRFEDRVFGGDSGSRALTGGAMFQLDVNTRIALTARLGLAQAHEERMTDVLFGMSVY
jgi:hypothetical protein